MSETTFVPLDLPLVPEAQTYLPQFDLLNP